MIKFIAEDIGHNRKMPKSEGVTTYNNEVLPRWTRTWMTYLHGKIEEINGFDLTYFAEGVRHVENTEEPCVVEIDRKFYECVLVQWMDEKGIARGLIVLADDHESLERCRKKAAKKPSSV